jgi:hypothetical protein
VAPIVVALAAGAGGLIDTADRFLGWLDHIDTLHAAGAAIVSHAAYHSARLSARRIARRRRPPPPRAPVYPRAILSRRDRPPPP